MPKRKKKSEKWELRGNPETDSGRKRRAVMSDPYPKTKKRMLGIKDVP